MSHKKVESKVETHLCENFRGQSLGDSVYALSDRVWTIAENLLEDLSSAACFFHTFLNRLSHCDGGQMSNLHAGKDSLLAMWPYMV